MIEELLAHINTIHSTTFRLVERYVTGEQGAFAIIDEHGTRYVLNTRSKNLLLKLGFTFEGNLRQRYYFRGQFEDEYYFGLLKDEWLKET